MVATSALLIGFEDCDHCRNALSVLESKGFNTSVCWASKKRKSPIPQMIKDWSGDYIFHLKSYYILPKKVIESAKNGVINFHPSPPRYPGSGGINRGLYNDDKISGVTVHYMNEKVDNGSIICFYKTDIEKQDNVEKLLSKVHKLQYDAFCDIIEKIVSNGAKFVASMSKNYDEEPWGEKTGRIKDIDQMEIVTESTSKEELERVIRATSIGAFGPKIILHNKIFRLSGE